MGANDAKAAEQYQRLMLMEEVCSLASRLGREALDRGEKLDIMEAYQRALVSTLERRGRTKNDLAALWAMLLLGSEAVKKISRETDSYTLGAQPSSAFENLPE